MQIIEICEPNANLDNSKEIAVGIDFGTTNSLIAVSFDQAPFIIADNKMQEIIPSKLSYSDVTISSIKRLFGKNFKEITSSEALLNVTSCSLTNINGNARLNIDGKLLSAVEIASSIFLKLKDIAQEFLKTQVRKAVITVPAYYDDSARAEVILAAKIAGFEVLRVLAEPTAAAYAYKLNKDIKGQFLIYDLGGGTFDISVLNMTKGVLQVIATSGDNMLGGDDIDLLIANYWSKKYNIYNKELIEIAKKAKEFLSIEENFSYEIDSLINIELSRVKFEAIIYPLIKNTINLVKDVLSELDDTEIKAIILVGGSTRIPLIRKLLADNFDIELLSDLDPDKVVALGAALQAENLVYGSNTILIDAVSLSLGLELYGGLVEKIIPRNSPLPFVVKKEYTTYVDNQTAIEFHIVQGEREFAKDCRSLAIFELAHLPQGKAGSIKIEVIFAIDLDGVLSVSAIEKTTQKAQTVIVKPSYGLSTEEINIILENSYKNVSIDHKNKLLKETILQAENLIKIFNKIIDNENFKNLSSKKEELDMIINYMKQSIRSGDMIEINANIEKFNSLISPFILDAVNLSVKKSLKGKIIN